MQRRKFLGHGGALAVALVATLAPEQVRPASTASASTTAFGGSFVRDLARDLATRPYQPPDRSLPGSFAHLTYDQYRGIRFDPAHALWRGMGLPFEVQFLHRGFLFEDRVDLFEVADGHASPIRYSPDMFVFGKTPRPTDDMGFSGFRIHAPINRPDYFDEVCVFQGASYFRAVAKGQNYGLSSRGLAIKTGDAGGEEFPVFKSFWLERPTPGTNAVVVQALLDSPSTSGAFRFTIRPGSETIFDVEMSLYPRNDIEHAGLAALTSMFFFDSNNRAGYDDYRRAIHDSDGLAMWTGRGEQLWRPLNNPARLQMSSFVDPGSRGFGLMQRKRQFDDYEDLEAHYEKRPSLWVEPIGATGEGAVQLVEIPTPIETNDNIVAFWTPKQPIKAKTEFAFTYRLHWCDDIPIHSDLARVTDTACGIALDGSRLFVIDVVGDNLKALAKDISPQVQVTANPGAIRNAVAEANPQTGGWRMSFELVPGDATLVELRAQLMDAEAPLSEVWIYRWTH
jgi:glucans biosynthesis protein